MNQNATLANLIYAQYADLNIHAPASNLKPHIANRTYNLQPRSRNQSFHTLYPPRLDTKLRKTSHKKERKRGNASFVPPSGQSK